MNMNALLQPRWLGTHMPMSLPRWCPVSQRSTLVNGSHLNVEQGPTAGTPCKPIVSLYAYICTVTT